MISLRWTIGLALLALPTVASGFVRSTTADGVAIQWPHRCIPFHLHEDGSTDLPFNNVQSAIIDSFQAWQNPECSGLEFFYQGITNDYRVGYRPREKNLNVIVFQEEPDEWVHQTGVIAVTTVTFCSAEAPQCPFVGAILDADMEINGSAFTFTTTSDIRRVRFDLKNTITHEAGHFIGLDHTSVADATMFPSAPPGERSKATLDEDDIDGVCEVYPADELIDECKSFEIEGPWIIDPNNPMYVDEEEVGCGDCSTHPTSSGPLWALFALLGMIRPRRRSRLRGL